ncbi:hypothetical protein RRF57_005017 [Xylaria bambusicola]|uniref:Uncharacterized protein n=1 Tax=Xylaria bambusicola TaxID=326684 RepID=A0AAN7Z540_9PEZI
MTTKIHRLHDNCEELRIGGFATQSSHIRLASIQAENIARKVIPKPAHHLGMFKASQMLSDVRFVVICEEV